VDENGYFVTEMVYEEVPDDSSDTIPVETANVLSKMEPMQRQESLESQKENQANQLPSDKKSSMQKASQPLKGKKLESKPSTGQQKNMMSFFGKKN
jgi:hypothetical protein